MTAGEMLFSKLEEKYGERVSFANMAFGERHPALGRYKLPLLPGEEGTKAGGDWVPRGVQSATNLAGSISETRGLGIWERQRSQLGLALDAALYERMAQALRSALADGVDLNEKLSSTPRGQQLAAELELIHDEAREICGANMAARVGTALHDGWEKRAPAGTQIPGAGEVLFGQTGEGEMFERLEALLAEKGLERVPGLQERVVRNVALNAAGRFDDILRTTRDIVWNDSPPLWKITPEMMDKPVPVTRIPAGTLLMADLKTKRKAFWTWLEVRIQLAVYATAEWMLEQRRLGLSLTEWTYAPGPKHHVSQEWGVVLHMPQDGAPPSLKRINLVAGLRAAKLARAVCDERSEGKAVATHAEAEWPS
jgi:hypothetical protein